MPKKTKLKSSNLNNQLTKDMSVNIAQIIRNNNIFVDEINQLLHNEGVEINNELDIIIALLNKKVYGIETDISISKKSYHNKYTLLLILFQLIKTKYIKYCSCFTVTKPKNQS